MSAKDGFEAEVLDLFFLNTDIANIGDAGGIRGSATAGSYWIAIYTVSPSDSAQGTECDYTGYDRVAVVRGAGGWTRTGNSIANTATVTFPQCTAGATDVAVAWTINTGSTPGTDDAKWWGSLTGSLTIDVGATPEFNAGALTTTCD